MSEGTLTIYSASAGSGKTFRLAAIYLSRLFRSKYNYRKILAVTFTNKATAEMKGRILDQLHCLAKGGKSEYLAGLMKETGKSEEVLRKEAGEILFAILHDFSRFSVCTIDAFFQKVIRAFAREHGLHSGFSIELDHSEILSDAVDEMIASSAVDAKLRNWLNNYVLDNLDDEKTWNLKDEILKLAEELFREKFKILSFDERAKLEDKEFLLDYISTLRAVSSAFKDKLIAYGTRCMKIYTDHDLTDDMFYYKSSGVPAFIKGICKGKTGRPGSNARKIEADPPKWSTGDPCPELKAALDAGLDSTAREAMKFYDDNIREYNSARAVLSNIYALGILSDVLRKVREISSSENSFLISEAGELLSLITRGDQTPFIYEKIGNRFENYMIDEFQDTSLIQWNNFSPLIDESMGGGHDNLVVGDVKQSIYRFRNSDWQILGRMKAELVDNKRFLSEPLKTNWRSRTNIIRFNNSLFSIIPRQTDSLVSQEGFSLDFKDLYSEAVQEDPGKNPGGYVRIEFVGGEKEDEDQPEDQSAEENKKSWKEIVLEKLPSVIETFLDKGYNASDIGILVREGSEGAEVLNTMISYGNSSPPEKRTAYNYNIVSNDSLLLSNSHAITFIVSVLRVLNNPKDSVSRAAMLRFYLLACGRENAESVPLCSTSLADDRNGYFPDGYEPFLKLAEQMTLFEATENIISFFGLGKYPWNVSYLNTFQDWVLNFSRTKNTDFQSFLDWWDTTGSSKSVVLPEGKDAARVFTIHKAKGLEFRIIIIPFISWNLDHKNQHHPILWIKPEIPPFNRLGIVPVRYQKDLLDTIFADNYLLERYSAWLDNINLLYVAMTRAKDAIWGFAPEKPGINNGIAKVIKEAIASEEKPAGKSGISPGSFYNRESGVFEYGEIPAGSRKALVEGGLTGNYMVSAKPESLKLKLHSENYFASDSEAVREKISHGKIMHEIFEGINMAEDIPGTVRRMVLEGKITESEADPMVKRLNALISGPQVSEWFSPGTSVLKEAGILLPSGMTRRPDRVIVKDDTAVIIDFKFGEENKHHALQVRQYRELLKEMGFRKTEGFLWYVGLNKIVIV